MRIFEGKAGIKVRILADSINKAGDRPLTYEVEYPRIIHSELMTHRMLSRNAASSRAIPFAKMMEQLTAMPVRFGANVSGMQDNGEHDARVFLPLEDADPCGYTAAEVWEWARDNAKMASKALADAGYHKQVFNRLTEFSQMIKVVVTATEWDNLFWLRNDGAADPTLHELARLMNDARNESTPVRLYAGHWHLPYVDFEWWDYTEYDEPEHYTQKFYLTNEDGTKTYIDLEDAIKVSCARCAAVSFRNIDYGVEKSREVFARLVGDQRKHASAFEHTATPIADMHIGLEDDNDSCVNIPTEPRTWETGISHMDRNKNLWSGNLRGFIQYRKLIPGENYVSE